MRCFGYNENPRSRERVNQVNRDKIAFLVSRHYYFFLLNEFIFPLGLTRKIILIH